MSQIIEQLSLIAKEVGAVKKDGRNTHQNFNFRGIDAVVNAVSPALRDHNVIVVPQLHNVQYSTVEVGSKRTLMGHVIVDVEYRFVAADGSEVSARVAGEAMDSGDKATPKAMSVAFRTALLQALTLPTDEPDPDADTYERTSEPDFTDEILEVVSEFTEWDDDQKRAEWIKATAAVGAGKPKTLEDVNTIAKQMREHYAAYLDSLSEEASEEVSEK